MSNPELLQFAPFSSALDTGFWYQLTNRKLNIYRLDDKPVQVKGFYTNCGPSGIPCLASIDYTAFSEHHETPPNCFPLTGNLHITNTLNDFKSIDKSVLIRNGGEEIWKAIISGEALSYPSLLSGFLCLTFADLKKYNYMYWFAFPALRFPEISYYKENSKQLKEYFNNEQIQQLQQEYDELTDHTQKAYFLIFVQENGEISVGALEKYSIFNSKKGKILLGFADPCCLNDHPGWPLRNFLSLVAYHWGKEGKIWDVICFRQIVTEGLKSCAHSLVLSVVLNFSDLPTELPQCVGWEKNNHQKLGPMMVNLSSTMDPTRLSESAVDLNLKLMRWRLIPELDLDKIVSTKCLLLGAGTLGCNVARCLLGWGIRTVTLVDNSQVSYSNPVRQSLFTFEDCLNGGKSKAPAAAETLKKIFPGVNAEGIILTIPMPGHPVPDKMVDQIWNDIKKLDELIQNHDAIFLLMDTRESRWLPTVIATSKKKLVINAALGFDTFLVMRHGSRKDTTQTIPTAFDEPVPGSHLGCYFCNDVVAPGNSTQDRTLDQQCTVTRPGISMMASALAVELMINILQHPEGPEASANTSSDDDFNVEPISPLGIIPHQIRAFLSRFQYIMPATRAFEHCIACSPIVSEQYEKDGITFLLKVFNEPNFLETLTGLTKLQQKVNEDEIWELDDEEVF